MRRPTVSELLVEFRDHAARARRVHFLKRDEYLALEHARLAAATYLLLSLAIDRAAARLPRAA